MAFWAHASPVSEHGDPPSLRSVEASRSPSPGATRDPGGRSFLTAALRDYPKAPYPTNPHNDCTSPVRRAPTWLIT